MIPRRDLLGAIACVPGAASLPSQPPKRKLLAIGDVHTKNYQHDAVSRALATVEQLGRPFGLYWMRTDTQLLTKHPIQFPEKSLIAEPYQTLNERMLFPEKRHLWLWVHE